MGRFGRNGRQLHSVSILVGLARGEACQVIEVGLDTLGQRVTFRVLAVLAVMGFLHVAGLC
jgi:hypothetical protein